MFILKLKEHALRRGFTAVALVLVVLIGVIALSDSAHAAKPDIQRFDTSLHISLPSSICGFPLNLDGEGVRTVKTHYDHAGEIVRIVVKQQSFGAFSDPANGKSLHFVVAWTKTIRPNDDGPATETTTGHIGSITVPGEGLIEASVGRLVTEGDTTVFEAGQHDPQFTEEFCAALS